MIVQSILLLSAHRPGAIVFEKDKPTRVAEASDFTKRMSTFKDPTTGADVQREVEEAKKDVDIRGLKQTGVAVFGGGCDREDQIRSADRDDRLIVVYEDRAEILTAGK